MTEQEQKAFDLMREALNDIKYGLEGSRIWGGMDWTYNPLHPFKYLPLRDKAEQALASGNAVSDQQEPRLPEYFARYEYASDFSLTVSVYQRRTDDVPVLVHREALPKQDGDGPQAQGKARSLTMAKQKNDSPT